MKNEKRVGKLIVSALVSAVLMVAVTGCMSMVSKMARSMIRDYGVYDSSVPEDQLCDFLFVGVNIKSFNGNQVDWGNRANNMGRIKLPAGTHDFVYDWVQEETRQTGSYYSGIGTTTTTYTTTTRSLRDLRLSQIDFLPGHRYSLAGGWTDGNVRIYIQDITNTLAEMYGDTVADAPKESRTPTNFEGSWTGSDGSLFKFAGNTWEMVLPPGVSTNYSNDEAHSRGTFELDGDKIIMYMTHVGAGGRWFNVGGLRTASIWTYSFAGANLELEIEYLLPKVLYSKQ